MHQVNRPKQQLLHLYTTIEAAQRELKRANELEQQAWALLREAEAYRLRVTPSTSLRHPSARGVRTAG